jgi:acetyltransferase-like isoleucine patch superfamily enzyme
MIKKILFLVCKVFIYILSYFDHRLYMIFYTRLLRYMGMDINGIPRYIGKDVKFDNYSKIKIGDRIVISNESILLTHDYSLTTALISINECPSTDVAFEKNIVIGNNVFIGKRSIIMPNSVIGNNVIIGAGTVVRGSVPDNVVVIGNPSVILGKTSDFAFKWKKFLNSDLVRFD